MAWIQGYFFGWGPSTWRTRGFHWPYNVFELRESTRNHKMQRLSNWKDAEVRRMCHRLASRPSLALHWGMHVVCMYSHLMGANHLTVFDSDGTVNFSIRTLSKTWAIDINLDILVHHAHALRLVPRISSSSIPLALTSSPSTTVTAAMTCWQIGRNCCVSNGFQQHFPVHKLPSLLTASKRSMNLCYRGRWMYKTTIALWYDDLIMLTLLLQL